MTVREAMKELVEVLCPHGPSFRPEWLNGNGVDERVDMEKLVLYVEPIVAAERVLHELACTDKRMAQHFEGFFWWQGYPIEICLCGPMRLL